MSDTPQKRRILRHVWAILAGFLAGAVPSLVTDVILHAIRVFPPWSQPIGDGLSALATSYRIVFGVAGSYIAGRLAPNRPMLHAMVLGVMGFAVCIVGTVVTWNQGLSPHWYPLALDATAIPCAWLGGRLSMTSSVSR
jgi:hypothetical protein